MKTHFVDLREIRLVVLLAEVVGVSAKCDVVSQITADPHFGSGETRSTDRRSGGRVRGLASAFGVI